MDLCHAVRTAVVGCDGLVVLLRYREDIRDHFGTPFERIHVVSISRIETFQAHAIQQNVRQQGVATRRTRVRDIIGVGSTALCIYDHLLVRVIDIGLENGLTLACLNGQYRQQCTFINRNGILKGIRIKSRSQSLAGYRHVLERSVVVFIDGVVDGILSGVAVLCLYGYFPLSGSRLTEEDYLVLTLRFVGNLRICTTGRKVLAIDAFCRIERSLNQRTVCVNGFQRRIGRIIAVEGDAIGCLIAHCVTYVQPCHAVFPEDLYILGSILLGVRDSRILILVGSLVIHRVGFKSLNTHVVQCDVRQQCRSRCRTHETNGIGVCLSVLGFYDDLGIAGGVRSGNRYLLSCRFADSYLGTSVALEFYFIVKRLGHEGTHAYAVEFDPLQISVCRSAGDKVDCICLLCAGLRRYGYFLGLSLHNAQYTLGLLGFLVSHGRDYGRTHRQRVTVVETVRTEVRDCHTADINHIQVGVRRGSHAEMDNIRTAGP